MAFLYGATSIRMFTFGQKQTNAPARKADLWIMVRTLSASDQRYTLGMFATCQHYSSLKVSGQKIRRENSRRTPGAGPEFAHSI